MSRLISLRTAIVLVLGWISVTSANVAEFTDGVLRAAATYVPQPCDGTKLTTCQSCNALELCLVGMPSDMNPVRTCPASTPYCVQTEDGATCQAAPDAQCSAGADAGFVCTGTGFFPDPNSCQLYHYCEKENEPGDVYDCKEGNRYNSRRKKCQRSGWRRCEKVKCDPASSNVFVPYPYDDQFYVYCQYDYSTDPPTFKKTYVLTCGEGSKFDEKKQVCKFQCQKEGLFANTVNPSQYFSCYRKGYQWVAEVKTCSKPNYIFDDELKRCKEDPNAAAAGGQMGTSGSDSGAMGAANANDEVLDDSISTTNAATTVVSELSTTDNPKTTTLESDTISVRKDCLSFLKELMIKNNIL